MVRAYFAADLAALLRLRAGEAIPLPAHVPSSEDEIDEFTAMSDASDAADVVIAADVDDPGQALTLDRVASFHLDADGSGDLAWYATQELDQVVAQLGSATS